MKMMRLKRVMAVALALCCCCVSEIRAEEFRKVENVSVETLKGELTTLPYWGEKNLLIFYVDPDRPRQCHQFTVDMEESKRAAGDNIYGFGIMNLKDAPFIPNSLACKIAYNRTKKNKATILADKRLTVAEAWDLGDCNNAFVLMIVSKEGELVYIHKGEFTEEEGEEFYRVVDQYR